MKNLINYSALQANEKVTDEAKLAKKAAADAGTGGGSIKELEEEKEKLTKTLVAKEKAMVDLSVKLQNDLMKMMENETRIATL